MPTRNSGIDAKRSSARLPGDRNNNGVGQAIAAENWDGHHKMNMSVAYNRTKKRGYDGNGADAVQAWMETLTKIDNMQEVNGIDCQFLTSKCE